MTFIDFFQNIPEKNSETFEYLARSWHSIALVQTLKEFPINAIAYKMIYILNLNVKSNIGENSRNACTRFYIPLCFFDDADTSTMFGLAATTSTFTKKCSECLLLAKKRKHRRQQTIISWSYKVLSSSFSCRKICEWYESVFAKNSIHENS